MLKKILITVVAVLGLLVLVGFLLPGQVHVERSITVSAARDQVFPLVADFKRFQEWSPWAQRDPNTKYSFSGPATGVGSKMVWASEQDDVGSGTQEVTKYDAPAFVETDLNFGPDGGGVAFFALEEVEGGTRVTWGFDTDLGANPIARYFGLMFDGMIGPDYEQGLASLEALVEGGAAK